MGAVLRGRDVDLGRDLAVKVLLEKHAGRPDVARRFIEEAQIGGQLQHPGVVPVYDIGHFGERPFFTMKLVKGKTLAALLDERGQPSEDLPRLLGIALQVCQAMAYAHAKGVIHRDLKPSNVMVGAFGEVQVMDWGLAKVLQAGGAGDEERALRKYQDDGTQIRTTRSAGSAGSGVTDTEAGSLLGTPAYMPPEQAIGDVANLDRRADVFGLGAILCEILTGKPPYVGRSGEEVRRKAANGDLAGATARLDACGADPELIALTNACLAPGATDRPRDAHAVADGLAGYLNGVQERLLAAERERAVAVVRAREERKRRKVQLALAASVAGLFLGGGAFAWWRSEQAQAGRERDARNAEAVAALLGQCEEALRASDAPKAKVALDAARKRSADGGAAAHAERLGRLGADLDLLRDLDDGDQFRWTPVGNRYPDPAAVAMRTHDALRRAGVDPGAGSVDEAAARTSTSVVRGRIVPALDRLLRQEKMAGVRAALRRVDADPYRDSVRDAFLADDRAKLVELAGQKAALEQPPGFVAVLGETPTIALERRRELMEKAVSRRPGDLSLLMTLGGTYPWDRDEGANERLRWLQAAVAAAPRNASALNNLGAAMHRRGRVDEAIACLETATELEPNFAHARINLGNVLADMGRVDDAIRCYRQGIALDPKYAEAHYNLGLVLHRKGRLDEAIACYTKATGLDPGHAKAHSCLGNALNEKGRLDEAIASHRKALAFDPGNALFHTNLGNAVAMRGPLDEAIACYQKAIALNPKLALSHYNLGKAMSLKGRDDEAIACYRTALALDPNHPETYCNLGAALGGRGQFAESLALLKRGHELGTKRPGWSYPSAQWVRQAEANAALEAKLPAFLKGEFQPRDGEERLGLARICQGKRLHRQALDLYAAAFADPKLAGDLRAAHRYNAACYAALTAPGKGEGAADLDDAGRTRFRQQALDWLRSDLALLGRRLETGQPADRAAVQQTMLHWQKDTDLAGLRDAAVLARLPTGEQRAFAQLWADVAAFLKKAAK
jgi:tetratricopeptide (TPR) repeat protein